MGSVKGVTDETLQAFLNDLTALTLKHGIVIDGCGCCGSPFLLKNEKPGRYTHDCTYSTDLKFVEEKAQ